MKRILVVDDIEENLYYLQALLSGNGHAVELAHNGEEALRCARQQPPDLVVSDLLMPVMDGYTLLRHWKADRRLRHIPFVVYTATYTEAEDEQLALRLGADAFILKPMDPVEFVQRLGQVAAPGGDEPDSGSAQPDDDTTTLLKSYNQALVRKLEDKMLQLEALNRELQEDIARRKQAEDKLERLAFYDPLTGLPNRRLMEDRLEHSLASSARQQSYGALLFIDLDHFKDLNDTRGHNVGDQLLVAVSREVVACMREGDTVARFGGDEFVVILEDLGSELELAAARSERVGEKILEALAGVSPKLDREFRTTASIGISLFQGREVSAEELVRRADTAMYQAKRDGRNTLYFYDPDMQAALEARLELERGLRQALDSNEFALYYQPQVDARGAVVGAEALLRWQSPARGQVPPAEFIPLAEATGLIVPIGLWVMRAAVAQLKAWEKDAWTARLELAVNVSPQQFYADDFVEQVLGIVGEGDIAPGRLKLELTEGLIMNDTDTTVAKMQTLRRAGLRFSIDDFGTGYSSLAYLTRLPLDQLKIDKSFVHNMSLRPENAVIVQTIIGMARNLNMQVIAEGVETAEQHAFLADQGCGLFQGYYFGHPVPVADFPALSAGVVSLSGSSSPAEVASAPDSRA
ncbi:two-component system response regulator [Haliea atlantica]|nr:diguanylate cyclase [Haliea sp.]MAL93929.1 diguanylate cyclase [Haliea sp.]|tara:strand:+ start:7810 stop:9717 length:1908 start_codon:yes stop_codon:yes gene_type:complete